MLQRHTRVPGPIVADLGAAHVAAGRFTRSRSGELRLDALEFTATNPDPDKDNASRATYAAWFGQSTLTDASRSHLRVALPAHLVLTKRIATPRVPRSKRARVLAFEAAQNTPYPLDEVVWDYGAVTEHDGELEAILAVAKRDALAPLEAGSRCGRIAAAIPAPFALWHCFRHNHPEQTDCTAIVSVGARSTTLLLVEGERWAVRSFGLGGNAISQAIAEALGLSFTEAETLKLAANGSSGADAVRETIGRATTEFAGKLGAEVVRSVAALRQQAKLGQPRAFFHCGGAASLAGLPAALEERLQVPGRPLEPFRRVQVSDTIQTEARRRAASLAELVGLAVAGNRSDCRPNLLPPDLKRAAAQARGLRTVVGVAALTGLALLPPVVFYRGQSRHESAALARLQSEVSAQRAFVPEIRRTSERLEAEARLLMEWQQRLAAQSNWIAWLADLERRLAQVGDVWIDRFGPATAGALPVTEPTAASRPVRFTLDGRMLDRAHPTHRVSAAAQVRVQQLLAALAASDFVARVENERFDNRQPGILRFSLVLVLNPATPL